MDNLDLVEKESELTPQDALDKSRDVEAVFFQPLPLPLTKNEKTTVGNFFNFCESVACLLLHFIILRKQKLYILQLLYLLRLSLLIRTTLCFFFLNIRTRVECRTVLFNLFVIAEPLMYFRVCHGTPTNKKLEITNCLQENQIFRYYNSKNN